MEFNTALIYLPEFYNPDSKGLRPKIEEDKFTTTADELARKFGGGTWHHGKSGIWWDKGNRYVDPNLRIFEVDIPDNEKDRDWLIDYIKGVLLKRFEQKAIYLKIVPQIINIYTILIE